jgi:4-amino-4-deoxy-L-arabinose transferase-like glycosyltransferase
MAQSASANLKTFLRQSWFPLPGDQASKRSRVIPQPMVSTKTQTILILLAVFLVSFALRLWIVDKRWINPDEGAHLMDAVLVLDGKIPNIDFDSRQPLYVYTTAVVFKLFGVDYLVGRLVPLTCSMLSGLFVFLITRKLFDENTAVLAAVVYWMLPLEVLNSTLVKMQPLAILLTCLSFYGLVRFAESLHKPWVVGAGIAAGLGFYVRESCLIIPVVAIASIVLLQWSGFRRAAIHCALFLSGYCVVVVAMLAYYSIYMPWSELLLASVSPIGFLMRVLVSLLGDKAAVSDVSMIAEYLPQGESPETYSLYVRYVVEACNLHSFLIIGTVFSVLAAIFCLFKTGKEGRDRRYLLSHFLPFAWLGLLSGAYAWQFATRGFFIDYFRELLPPLVIICSAFVCKAIDTVSESGMKRWYVPAGLMIGAAIFVMQANSHGSFGSLYYASLTVAAVTLLVFAGVPTARRDRKVFILAVLGVVCLMALVRLDYVKRNFPGIMPSIAMMGLLYGVTWLLLRRSVDLSIATFARFVGLSIVAGAFVVSICNSADLLNLEYDSDWSPQALRRTSEIVHARTGKEDQVMSGAVIWEVQAMRRPFQTISHPLAMIGETSGKQRGLIREALLTAPPKVIILDGYTEFSYLRQVPEIARLIETRYDLVATERDARYPIEIYFLK